MLCSRLPRPSKFLANGQNIQHTPYTTHKTLCHGRYWIFSIFSGINACRADHQNTEESVITWHKQGLTPTEICKTGFDHHFVTRWIAKYNDSGSLDDAKRAAQPQKLSKSVERTVERKMRRKRRRSSRVIARELKRQKVCDVSYKTPTENSASPRCYTRF